MQRFVNNPDMIVEDMISGFVKAHKDTIVLSEENDHVVVKKDLVKGKVGIVSGGGSGHEPCFLGYVGKNMLDSVAVGEVFSSPPATAFYQAFKEADQGAGVACLFGNYAGDNMNVKMAIKMAKMDGIDVKYVVATDDLASQPKENKEDRHGIAGGFFMWKIGCGKAALGGSLDEVIEYAQKAVDSTRSICIGLSACTIPAVGHPNFEIKEGTMEYGIGHHGEPGINVTELRPANEIANHLSDKIFKDLELNKNDEIAVILSGLGCTPLMELYVLYDEVENYFKDKGISIYKSFIGDYVTSLDMNGAALTVMKLNDEFKDLLDLQIDTPAVTII
ncbi:MAG: dihydroxyacetone kinase subunit DhaK [Erysipelotrichaceae bacterium]